MPDQAWIRSGAKSCNTSRRLVPGLSGARRRTRPSNFPCGTFAIGCTPNLPAVSGLPGTASTASNQSLSTSAVGGGLSAITPAKTAAGEAGRSANARRFAAHGSSIAGFESPATAAAGAGVSTAGDGASTGAAAVDGSAVLAGTAAGVAAAISSTSSAAVSSAVGAAVSARGASADTAATSPAPGATAGCPRLPPRPFITITSPPSRARPTRKPSRVFAPPMPPSQPCAAFACARIFSTDTRGRPIEWESTCSNCSRSAHSRRSAAEVRRPARSDSHSSTESSSGLFSRMSDSSSSSVIMRRLLQSPRRDSASQPAAPGARGASPPPRSA